MSTDPDLSRDSNRWVRLSMAGVAALIILSVAVPAMTPDADPDKLENEIHTEINEQRQAAGVSALRHDERMRTYAAGYSGRMATEDFFSHTPPDGVIKERISCEASGENLFLLPDTKGNESELAAEIVSGWMDSKQHRQNILDPRWREEGVGVSVAGDTIVKQRFCG